MHQVGCLAVNLVAIFEVAWLGISADNVVSHGVTELEIGGLLQRLPVQKSSILVLLGSR